MGDTRKQRKQYSTPRHPWEKARIEYEKKLVKEYGLKNKQEVYKHDALIKRIIRYYKELNYQTTEQAQKEQEQLFAKVQRLGYLSQKQEMPSILSMTVENSLDRRLQTLVFKKGLARTVKQARQFITHQHILVNGKVVDAPSYLVPVSDEEKIEFIIRSPLFDTQHPERKVELKAEEQEVIAKKEKSAEKVQTKEPTETKQDAEEEVTPIAIEEESEGEKQ